MIERLPLVQYLEYPMRDMWVSTNGVRTAGYNTHLSRMIERLRKVVYPCIVLIVVGYVRFNHDHATALNGSTIYTGYTQCDCSSRRGSPNILPPILGVNSIKIISAWPNILNGTFRRIIHRIVVLFSELPRRKKWVNAGGQDNPSVTYLKGSDEFLRRNHTHL